MVPKQGPDSMLPRTRHSQNHSRGHSRKQVVALPHSMALEARLSQLPQTTHNGTSDSTTHHMRRSTPARGPSSAVYATQQNARAGLLALSLRLTCRLVDCSDLIQHRTGSSHRLSIIAHQRTEVQGRGECTHVFSGSICTTRSFFPLCHPEKCHCNEV